MKFGGTSDVQFRRYDRGQTNTQIQTDRQTLVTNSQYSASTSGEDY